jgi:hypothetical protein
MAKQEILDYLSEINEKKVVEFKIGKNIDENYMDINIEYEIINKFIEILKAYEIKYFYNIVYYYNNLQLIINTENGSQKCYKDNCNMVFKNINTDKYDLRITLKNREKFNELLFPSLKDYDMIITRELISISLKDNLKINIYNKNYDSSNEEYNYEITIQYLYNPKKNDNINSISNEIFKYFEILNNLYK